MASVHLTAAPIEYQPLVEAVRSVHSGAVVLFLGAVRDMSEGMEVTSLHYEAHAAMAEKEIGRLVVAARIQWGLDDCRVIHRFGELALGDIAVAVVTASPHRAEAFEAARWVMDEIKKSVPIWKRETFANASANWVHPVESLSAKSANDE